MERRGERGGWTGKEGGEREEGGGGGGGERFSGGDEEEEGAGFELYKEGAGGADSGLDGSCGESTIVFFTISFTHWLSPVLIFSCSLLQCLLDEEGGEGGGRPDRAIR